MGDWLLDLLTDFLSELVSGILDLVGDVIDGMFITMLNANEMSYILGLNKLTTSLGITLLGVAGIKRVLDVYVFQTKGDADADPLDILYRVAMCVAVIGVNEWIYDALKEFFFALADDIHGIKNTAELTDNIRGVISAFLSSASGGMVLAFLLFVIVLLIGLIIFTVESALRAAQVTCYRILLPIFAVDLITSDHEKWNSFLWDYIMQFGSYCIQIICFQQLSNCILEIGISKMHYMWLSFAWLFLAFSGPEAIKKHLKPTGLAATAGKAAQVAVLAIRK